MEMTTSKRRKWAVFAVAVTLIAGCEKKAMRSRQAEKKDAAQGVPAPSIAETKAIAEEGFIYGLPIVMNYAVKYAFAVDSDSEPIQGALQSDHQRSPRLYLQGHGHRHAQQ